MCFLCDHTESQDTATDESDEQDSSSSDSSDDSGSSPDRNNTLLESNNSSPPPERERETLTEPEMGGSIFDSSGESTSNQEHFHTMVPDQALITLEREETRPTVESDESILERAGTNCDNQSSPTNSNNISCVSDYFQKQLDMLSPYQLENLTNLGNGVLLHLERKYRTLPQLGLWERLVDMNLVGCYEEMVSVLFGIRYEDSLPSKTPNNSTTTLEEIRKPEPLAA